MNADMKGFTQTWYEICNVDGHPLVLAGVENNFPSEEMAATCAVDTCKDYRDTITVKAHTTEIIRIFHAEITVSEV